MNAVQDVAEVLADYSDDTLSPIDPGICQLQHKYPTLDDYHLLDTARILDKPQGPAPQSPLVNVSSLPFVL